MPDRRILIFTFFWFILNLVQSFFTEIIDDEAYYWVFSQFLDWGFFDHPPMIALLIRLGYTLLPDELGVRLLTSLLGAGTIFLVLQMLKDQVNDFKLPMLVIFSIPLLHFHVAGFIATPDLPLVFSATLFFFFYKRYLANETPVVILLLSLSITMMLYSKYHAFLVIGFTILSNLRIVFRRSFWLTVMVSLLLYLPHIIWQVRHDFVSFGYHLIDRNNPFQFSYLLEYIGNQLLVVGPLCGIVLLYLAITRKTTDKFHAALKFNLIGFLLFFLASSFRGHVEPHWTAVAFVPLLLLSVPMIQKKKGLRIWVYRLSIFTILFIMLIRLSLMIEFDQLPDKISHRIHNKEKMFKQIQKTANGRPVVFSNSYQKASLYWFFTKEQAFSQNNKHYRKNQFDLLNLEANLHGKEVLYFPTLAYPGCDTLKTFMGDFEMQDIDYFCHFNRIEVTLPNMDWEFSPGEIVQINLELGNPTSSTIYLSDSCTHKPWLVYSYFTEEGIHKAYLVSSSGPLPDLDPGECITYPVGITVPMAPGNYQLMFSFGSQYLPSGINGRPVKMKVHLL